MIGVIVIHCGDLDASALECGLLRGVIGIGRVQQVLYPCQNLLRAYARLPVAFFVQDAAKRKMGWGGEVGGNVKAIQIRTAIMISLRVLFR